MKQGKLRSRLDVAKPLSVDLEERIIAFNQSECYRIASIIVMEKAQLRAKTTLKT